MDSSEWHQFEKYYLVNRIGQIKTIERRSGPNKKLWKSIIRKPGNCKGYRFVSIHNDGKKYNEYVHRIVATAFIPNPNNLPEINHINGIKHDNRVENLEWCTHSRNMRHSFNMGLHKSPDHSGSKHPQAILNFKQVQTIIKHYWSKKFTAKELAAKYGVARNYIYVVAAKRSWKKQHLDTLI